MSHPKSSNAMTPAERTRKWREARKERGGRELNVSLTPANAEKAWLMVEHGAASNMSALVNRLIELA